MSLLVSSLVASLAAAQILPPAPNALPSGGKIMVGTGAIRTSGAQMTIDQATSRLGLDWQSFNIGSAASVEFHQPSASAIALNRIVGNDASAIYGKLSANGQVFLVNPNGVLFAPGAKVDVGALVASTLDLAQSDFAAGVLKFKDSGSAAWVVNQGRIAAAPGGYIGLFGRQVSNEGEIAVRGGSVLLASGNAATLAISDSGLLSAVVDPGATGQVANRGLIEAPGSIVTLTARSAAGIAASLVNNSGIVRAASIVERNGEILLTGDSVANSGTLAADGSGSLAGGRIVLQGDMVHGETQVGGSLSAIAENAVGGFIETSAARVTVADGTLVRTASSAGRTGIWLIDPIADFNIAASGGNISGTQLGLDLAGGDITIGTGGSAANINVNDAVSWAAHKLTLSAQSNILVNAALIGTGSASLAFEYGQGAAAVGNTASYTIATPVTLPAGANFSTKLGNDGTVKSFTVITDLAGLQNIDIAPSNPNAETQLASNYALGASFSAGSTGSGDGFNPIGDETSTTTSTTKSFTGTFDGLGNAISGLSASRSDTATVGLFASTRGATVQNLTLAGGAMSGNSYVGGVAGFTDAETAPSTRLTVIRNVASSIAVTSNGLAGGLVGNANSTLLDHNSATGAVSGKSDVGGVAGRVTGAGTLTDNTAGGNVTGAANSGSVGGLVGNYQLSTAQTGNTASGAVSGGYNTGGLIGYYDSGVGLTEGSYLGGTVSGGTYVGGLIGYMNQAASITGPSKDNPWVVSTNVTGTGNGGGAVGGFVGRSNGLVANLKATGDVTSGNNSNLFVGGLIGQAVGTGTLKDSTATGTVTGPTNNGTAGGLVGVYQLSGAQTGNKASGVVSGGHETGGLIGYYDSTAPITDGTYAQPSITGGTWVGGLIGYMNKAASIAGPSADNPWVLTTNVTATANSGGAGVFAGRAFGSLSNLTSSGVVTANGSSVSAGGIAGRASGSTGTQLTALVSSSNVSAGSSSSAGGLIGWTDGSGTLSGSRASGTVALITGSGSVGGLVGAYAFTGAQSGNSASGQIAGSGNVGGLIGYYNSPAAITDGSYTNASISGGGWVGGLVGYMNSGSIVGPSKDNPLTVAVNVTSGANAGGVAGRSYGPVANVKATGEVKGAGSGSAVGGLIGEAAGTGTLKDSVATGSVTGGTNVGSVGGLAGEYNLSGAMSGNTASGVVSGGYYTGGLVGYYSSSAAISDGAYGQPSISGGTWVGGLVGYMYNGSIVGPSKDNPLTVAVNVTSGASAGGVAGRSYGTVANVKSTGNVTGAGSNYIGGLVGQASGTGSIKDSTATGNVTATANSGSVGGLVGGYFLSAGPTGNTAGGVISGGSNVGGLYGYYDSTGAITDGTYTQASIAGGGWVGGLVGYMYNGSIIGPSKDNPLTVAVNVTSGANAGGVAGRSYGPVANVKATGEVKGAGSGSAVGGLIGEAAGTGTLKDSVATGSVTGGTNVGSVGGLAGEYNLSGAMSGNTASGVVSGGYYTGGLVGYYSSSAAISDGAYGQPSISGGTWVGGLVGYMYNGSIVGPSKDSPLTVAVNVTSGASAGGVAGRSYGTVANVKSTGNVTGAGSNYIGGLVGQASGTGSVKDSTATGNVTATANSGSVGGLVGGYFLSAGPTGNTAGGVISGGSNVGGLYGYYDSAGAITDGTYTQGSIAGGGWVGGLVGYMYNGSIVGPSKDNPLAVAVNVTSGANAGGVAGRSYGTVANVKSTGNVTGAGSSYIGGLVGLASGTGSVKDSTATGNVTATANSGSVGGLVGEYDLSGAMSGNTASGVVSGGYYTGGLVGYYSSAAAISDGAYGQPSISGGTWVGGLVGYMYNGSIVGPSKDNPLTVAVNVTSGANAGGVAGRSYGPVANVKATGDVKGAGSNSAVGGLIGEAAGTGTLKDSVATGNVTGGSNVGSVGGLVGEYNLSGAMNGNTASGVVSGGYYTGGLVGFYNAAAAITDGTYTGASVSGGTWVGGLVGYMYQAASIIGPSKDNPLTVTANVTSGFNAGGVAGRSYGPVANVKATGEVKGAGSGSAVGGLIGEATGTGTLKDSVATGEVSGGTNVGSVGGLVGEYNLSGAMSGNSASGAVIGGYYTGGLVGFYNSAAAISDGTYAGGSVSGGTWVGGFLGYMYQAASITGPSANNPIVVSADVSGNGYSGAVGGFVGRSYGPVSNVKSLGSVSGGGDYSATGGLIGVATGTGALSNATATGNVAATTNYANSAGGLVGSYYLSQSASGLSASGNVNGGYYAGGLIGYYDSSAAITGGTYTGSSVSGGTWVGGLLGYMSQASSITGPSKDNPLTVAANITSGVNAGGVVGRSYGPVTNVKATGEVKGAGSDSAVGGLIGEAAGTGTLKDSVATGSVTGGTNAGSVGGLVGEYNLSGAMSGNAASGVVSGGYYTGGLVGYYNSAAAITDAPYTGSSVSGGTWVGGVVGYINGSAAVTGLTNSAAVTATGTAGGVIGRMAGALSGATASGTVTAGGDGGGIVGTMSGGSISNVTSSAKVVADDAGGVAGTTSSTTISKATATGLVAGNNSAGGLVGSANGSATISGSSASGNVSSSRYAGGLVGWADNIGFANDTASGNVLVSASTATAGGLVGQLGGYYYSYYGTSLAGVTGSHATGSVTVDAASAAVGGLVGTVYDGGINGSSASGNVLAKDSTASGNASHYAGGLVGYFGGYYNAGSISSSSASGTVSGQYHVGGLVGQFYHYGSGSISASSATGPVEGARYVGGLAGYFYSGGTIGNNSSASGGVSGGATASGGLAGYVQAGLDLGSVTASGNVNATGGNAGGLVGELYYGHGITNGIATGNVSGSATSVGGLVGYAYLPNSASGITGSQASGNVSSTAANASLGGLVGNIAGSYGVISNSQASGDVTALGNSSSAGGLVGRANAATASANGDISRSFASGNVAVKSGSSAGGLVGYFGGNAGIQLSGASGNVIVGSLAGDSIAGGLVGEFGGYSSAAIRQSYATGAVSAAAGLTPGNYAELDFGGLVGRLDYGYGASVVTDAYATGSVTVNAVAGSTGSSIYAGGLIGRTIYSNLARAYSTGAVSASGASNVYAGGLVGGRYYGSETASQSFWATDSSGQASSPMGTASTHAAMQQLATYPQGSNGWSIANTGSAGTVWRVYEGLTTPLLAGLLTPATVTLADASKAYDGTTSFGNAVIAGVVGGNAGNLVGSLVVANSSAADVGTYNVASAGVYSTQRGYDLTVSGSSKLTVTPRPLSLVGVIADKVYDGTTTATLKGTGQPSGLVAGEDLTINGSLVSASFDTKNVGTNKTVTVTGYTIADGVNGKASNYSLGAGTQTNASITPRPLTGVSLQATDRAYNGTNIVAVQATGGTLAGVLGNDQVAIDSSSIASGTMADKNVGTAKPVAVIGGALTGADASNYSLSGISGVTVNITPATLVVNGLQAQNRQYDASKNVSVSTSNAVLTGLFGSDIVALVDSSISGQIADKNVGSAKAVTVSSLRLRGPDAGNYTAVGGATAVNITPYSAYWYIGNYGNGSTDKVYDGTPIANVGKYLDHYSGDDVGLNFAQVAYVKGSGQPDKNVAYSGNSVTSKTIVASGATLSGTDAANYSLPYTSRSTSGTISPLALSVTGVTAVSRPYDGTTDVTLNLSNASVDLTKKIAGDDLGKPITQSGTVQAQVANKNVGNAKPVTNIPSFELTGGDRLNYTISGSNGVTVDITPKPVNVTYTSVNKVYDHGTYASVTGSTSDWVSGDNVNFYTNLYGGWGGSFADKNVGNNKPVTVSVNYLDGPDRGNYTLVNSGAGSTTASITPKPITPVFTGVNKVYDGLTSATVTLDPWSSGINYDDVTSTQTAVYSGPALMAKNVGNNKPVTVSNIVLAGSDLGNYTLASTTASTTASITPKPVTISGITPQSRPYDGTTLVNLTVGTLGSAGFVVGDDVKVSQPVGGLKTGTVADKSAANNKPVTVTGLALDGTNKDNYSIDLAGSGLTVNIGTKPVNAVFAGIDRVYNGGTAAQVTGSSADILGTDSVTFSQTAAFTGVNAADVGSNKPIAVTNVQLGGTDGANYALVSTSGSATAAVTPKPVTMTYVGQTRVYDGKNDTSATVLGASPDFVASDLSGLTWTQTAAFAGDGSAGVGKAINVNNIQLGGSRAFNYQLASTSANAVGTIAQRPIAVTGIKTTNRDYDGTLTVAIDASKAVVDVGSLISADDVKIDVPSNGVSTGTMLTRDVGLAKPVQIAGLGLKGVDKDNYTLSGTANVLVDIAPKSIVAVYAAAGKVYDGGLNAAVGGSSSGILPIDAGGVAISAIGAFADKNAGAGKTVTVTGGYLTGSFKDNYSLSNTSATALASITPKTLNPSYSGSTRVYDGTTNAPVTATTGGIVSGDAIGFTQTASFLPGPGGSPAKNVGTNKPIAVTGIAINGADQGNYQLASTTASATGTVTAKPITVTGLTGVTATSRTYDTTTQVDVVVPSGAVIAANSADIVVGDKVTISVPSGSNLTGTMADKNAGTNKAVTINGLGLAGTDAVNYSIRGVAGVTVDITPKPLTAAYVGPIRVYDAGVDAAVTGTSADILGSDSVSIAGDGRFADKNVGAAKAITVTGGRLAGGDKANYALLNPTGNTTGTITARPIAPVITGGTKVYDGTLDAPIAVSSPGVLGGDVVSFAPTAAFTDSKDVGSNKPVSVSAIALGGTDGGNYSLTSTTGSTVASVTQRPVTLVGLNGVTAASRVYDGTADVVVNLNAAGAISVAAGDLVLGDLVSVTIPIGNTTSGTVPDKNVGNNKPVTVTGLGLAGKDAPNYSIAATQGLTANITPKPLTAVYTGPTRVYDAGVVAFITGSSADKVGADDVGILATGSFADKHVGSNKAIAVTGGRLEGGDKTNYALQNPTGNAFGTITPLPIGPVITGGTKVYDGKLDAPVAVSSAEVLGSDVVTFTPTALFTDSKNVGSNKPVSVSAIALGGADGGNYSLTSTTGSTVASITQRPVGLVGLNGVSATSRPYDGTTDILVNLNAIGTISVAPGGLIAGDKVSVTIPNGNTTTGTVPDKNVDQNKPVTVTGLGLTGNDAPNYSIALTQGVTADITPKPVTAVYAGATRAYDQTTAVTLNVTTPDIVSGDTVTLSANGSYADKNAGSNKPIGVSGGALAGLDAGNYNLVNPTGTGFGTITPLPIGFSYVGGSKVYDQLPNAPVTGALSGVLQGDVVALAQSAVFTDAIPKSAGVNKPVSITGIQLSGSDAINYSLAQTSATTTATVTPRPVTISGLTGLSAVNRIYDGTVDVALTVSGALGSASGQFLPGDQVSIQLPAGNISGGTMLDKNAGVGKPVTVNGLTLSGADAGNYAITATAGLTVDIAKRPVTAVYSGVTRLYDQTTTVQVTGTSGDIVGGDDLAIAGDGVFTGPGAKNAGVGKPINVLSASLSGADQSNYLLSNPTGSAVGEVTKLPLNAAFTGGSKIYDQTLSAPISSSVSGILAGDEVNLSAASAVFTDSKNVGANKPIAVSGISLTGADAVNYSLNSPSASTTGSVTPKPVTISGLSGLSAVDRVYNGTVDVALTVNGALGVASGQFYQGDQVSIQLPAGSITGGAMLDKNAGQNKPVIVSGIQLTGNDAPNYQITATQGVTVNIAKLVINAAYAGVDRIYDGTANVQVTGSSGGILGGDTLTIDASGVFTGAGAKNVGVGKPVDVSGGTLGGIDAGNYSLNNPIGTTAASVSAKSISFTYAGGTRVYDGGTLAPVTGSLDGAVQGDIVSLTQTAVFGDGKAAGNDKPVAISGIALAGVDAGNYSLPSSSASASGSVTPKPVTVSGLAGVDRVYDGTVNVAVAGTSASLSGMVQGDNLSLTLPGGGALSGTMADKNAGSAKPVTVGGLALGGADAANYTLQGGASGITVNIAQRPVTVSGLAGVDRAYDGTVNVAVAGTSASLSGMVQGDNLSLTLPGGSALSGTMADKNVGNAKLVTVGGLALGGADAANYTLQGGASGITVNIAQRPVTVGGLAGVDRVYDGTVNVAVAGTSASLSGMVQGDNLSLTLPGGGALSGTMADKNAGSAKPVTVGGLALGGADAANYTLQGGASGITVNIAQRPVTVSGLAGVDRIYDGTVNVAVAGSSASLSGMVQGDNLSLTLPGGGALSGTVADKNAGSAKLVTVGGLALGGADAANYTLQGGASGITVNVAQRPVTVSGLAGVDRVYDGTVNVAVAGTSASLSGMVQGDNLSLTLPGGGALSGTMADKNVGNAKPVTVGGLALGGADAANYTLQGGASGITVNIAQRPVTVTGLAGVDRVYDGTVNVAVAGTSASLSGMVQGDNLSLTLPGGGALSGTMAEKSAASAKPVTVGGLTLGGADAANYTLQGGANGITVNIAQRPVTVSGLAGVDRVYDGTVNVAVAGSSASLNGMVQGDSLSLTLPGGGALSGTMADKNVGNAKLVTVGGLALGGADAANYTLQGGVSGVTVNIAVKPMTATYFGIDKVYDGTTSAAVNATSADLISGDSVSVSASGAFLDKKVGKAKPINVSAGLLNGFDATNYALTNPNGSASADISPRPLTASYTGVNKVFDGTVSATVNALAANALLGDSVSVSATGAFADINVGKAKPIVVSGGVLAGSEAGNYQLSNPTGTAAADITARPLSIAANTVVAVAGQTSGLNFGFSTSAGGLVNGDHVQSVATSVVDDQGAAVDVASAAGGSVFRIKPSGGAFDVGLKSNYDMSYQSGLLIVVPKPPAIGETGSTQNAAGEQVFVISLSPDEKSAALDALSSTTAINPLNPSGAPIIRRSLGVGPGTAPPPGDNPPQINVPALLRLPLLALDAQLRRLIFGAQ